jgi:hypothetical protein
MPDRTFTVIAIFNHIRSAIAPNGSGVIYSYGHNGVIGNAGGEAFSGSVVGFKSFEPARVSSCAGDQCEKNDS